MARKSILDGGASQSYSTCHGDKCEAPARKAVVLTSMSESGADSHVVPLCKNCETKAKSNATSRGLAAPHSTRLTKSIAQNLRDMDSDSGKAKPINPHKGNKERLQGKRPVNSSRPHLVGKAPESMTKAHTIKINQLDPERAMPISAVDSDTPIGRAYRDRHMEIAKRRRTPKERTEIVDQARKGIYEGKYE
jgi:hypothetical protein